MRTVGVTRCDELLSDAAEHMLEQQLRCLIVVIGDGCIRRPIGVLTERDILAGMLAHQGRRTPALSVGDVMSLNLVTAHEREPIEAVLEHMHSFCVHHVPVVNETGALVGLITSETWIEYLESEVVDLVNLLFAYTNPGSEASRRRISA